MVPYKASKQESFTITVGVNEQQCYGLQWLTNSTTNNATTFNKNLLLNYVGVTSKIALVILPQILSHIVC